MVEKILNKTTPYGKIRASHEGSLHSSTLKKDVNTIHKSNSLIIPADKKNNYYKLDKGEYDKLLKDNATAENKQI